MVNAKHTGVPNTALSELDPGWEQVRPSRGPEVGSTQPELSGQVPLGQADTGKTRHQASLMFKTNRSHSSTDCWRILAGQVKVTTKSQITDGAKGSVVRASQGGEGGSSPGLCAHLLRDQEGGCLVDDKAWGSPVTVGQAGHSRPKNAFSKAACS